MAILFSNEIMDAVVKELHKATDSVQIITAYCKEKMFKYLDSEITTDVQEKKLLVRFRLDDILKGSTDFGVLQYGIDHGWNVYIRFDLHAKTYIVDNKRGLVGSANVTNSGLNIGKSGNMEMAAFVDVELDDVEKIGKLFNDAILVNDSILGNLREQFSSVYKKENIDGYSWDDSIMKLFRPHIETLFSYELPDDFELKTGEYFQFLDESFDGNIDRLKETFRWSNVYLWLLDTLRSHDGCMHFGELSASLHNTVVSDPKPYRKDVKQMLANLLRLIEELKMDEIVIDRPNYSQRIQICK
mgnify:FL=1